MSELEIIGNRRWEALLNVAGELRRQDQKWGIDRNHEPEIWLAILSEEVGELATAMLHYRFTAEGDTRHPSTMREEAVQIAAVAVALIEYLDRQEAHP